MGRALAYLPVAVPFGILTIVGGINVTESARLAGDDYKTRDILLAEAFSTLIAGVCGGVAQSTPYIGHPAYKRMGGRAGYTLFTGLFIGLGGVFRLRAVRGSARTAGCCDADFALCRARDYGASTTPKPQTTCSGRRTGHPSVDR